MYKQLKKVEDFLNDDNKETEAILTKVNELRPKDRIKWLRQWTQKADEIYNGAPDLKPRDLRDLIERFEGFQRLAEEDPTKLEVDFRAIMLNKEYENRDDFIQLLENLDNKSNGQLDRITGDLKDWDEKGSPNDWQERIEKLTCLKELYPVWENISEILEEPATARANTEADSPNIQTEPTKKLSNKCLGKIREIAKKNSFRSSKYVIKNAYENKCCKYEIDDGEKEKIGSWYTLRNRLKDFYPELYKMTFKK